LQTRKIGRERTCGEHRYSERKRRKPDKTTLLVHAGRMLPRLLRPDLFQFRLIPAIGKDAGLALAHVLFEDSRRLRTMIDAKGENASVLALRQRIEDANAARIVGRYALHQEFAAGGMATVHFGHLRAEALAPRIVAIKRLRPEFGTDPGFAAVFVEEALRAARVRHPNVVRTLDVIADRIHDNGEKETFVVMEYVEGESLARLLRALRTRKEPVPPALASAIVSGVLRGLEAAHDAKSEDGAPLGVVHRDLSPQNVIVGTDGIAHVLDFGIGSATGETHTTRAWKVVEKLGYMSPEGLATGTFTARSDVYSAAVVLWEMLTLRRLFDAESQGELMVQVARGNVVAPSRFRPELTRELDLVVLHGLARDPAQRWATAGDFARALAQASPPAPPAEVAAWVRSLASDGLALRARLVAEMEKVDPWIPPTEGIESARSPSEPVPQGFTRTNGETNEPFAGQSRAGRSQLLVAVGLIALLVAALPLLFLRRSGPAVSAPPPREVILASPSNDPTALALPEPLPPPTGVPPEEERAPSAPPPLPEPPRGEADPAPSLARPKPPLPLPSAKPDVDCDPPFSRDALGHKHFKIQCL
jgi:serine/threonine-protein kinase